MGLGTQRSSYVMPEWFDQCWFFWSYQVKIVRLYWPPAVPGHVKMVEYVRSRKIIKASPASALKDGKVYIFPASVFLDCLAECVCSQLVYNYPTVQ